MLDRLSKLFTVKSIVTIMLTVVFCIMAVKGTLSQEFMVIYTVVIGFYFGTQHEKKSNAVLPE